MTRKVYEDYGSDPAVFIWSKRTSTNDLRTNTGVNFTFSTLQEGTYVFIAYGMNERPDPDSDRTPTFEYVMLEYSFEQPSEAYLSWIGKWEVTDDTPKTDIWTVSANVTNASYDVKGMGGNAGFTIDAIFDPETGQMKFKSHKDFKTVVVDGETCIICLYGTNGSTFSTGTYDLMYAAFDDGSTDAATLISCNPEKYTKYKFYGYVDGAAKYNYGTRTLPSTMTRSIEGSAPQPDGWSGPATEEAASETVSPAEDTPSIPAE